MKIRKYPVRKTPQVQLYLRVCEDCGHVKATNRKPDAVYSSARCRFCARSRTFKRWHISEKARKGAILRAKLRAALAPLPQT
jgi:hypothetical protein